MKRNIFLAALLACIVHTAHTQETITAWNTPNGIFVNWPSAPVPGDTWILERSDGWTFQKIAEIEGPKSGKQLRKREQEAFADFPNHQKMNEALLDTFWVKSRQKPLEFDGERFPALQIAFGRAWHDKSIRTGVSYRYRLSRQGQVLAQSQPFAWEKVQLKDRAQLLRSASKGQKIELRWCALPANPRLAWFKIMRSDMGKDSFAAVDCFRRLSTRNDSLILTMYDDTPEKISYFSYYVVLYDWLGNAGPASAVITADNLNESTQPFTSRFHATGLADSRAVRLDWRIENSARVNGVQVFRSRFWDHDYELVAELSARDSSYTDKVSIANEAFYYYLGLVDVTGAVFNTQRAFGISTYNEVPAAPAPVISQATDKGVRLFWQHSNPHVIGFQVYRADPATDTTPSPFRPVSAFLLRDTAGFQTFYDTSAELRGGQEYAYYVVARGDGFAFGPASDTVYARPNKPIYIRPLQLFDPLVQTDSNRIMIVWENRIEEMPTLVRYRVYRKLGTELEFDTARYQIVEAPENAFIDQNVQPNTQYAYTVCAEDVFGNVSPQGLSVTARLNKPVPAVERLLAEPLPNGVQLRWADLSQQPGIRAFRIWRKDGVDTKAKLLGEAPAASSSYTDKSVQPNNDYYYYLTVVSAAGEESEPSPLVLMQR